ncbi:MAG: hypothetical protein HYV60_25170 [Planctomycetia bacterium]|nr:hypothetical protein [Planctomycetia bacterium]
MLDFIEKSVGGEVDRSFAASLPGASCVEVHVIPATRERRLITLFTTGVSSAPALVQQIADYAIAEFYIQLPPYWQIDKDDDPLWNWPILWLHKLGDHAVKQHDWPASPVSFVANDEPPMPLSPNT